MYVCETAPFFLLCERTKRTWKRRGITSYGLGSHRCLSSELSSVSSSARPTCSPAVMMSFNCAPNETLAPRLPTVRCWCTFPLGRFFSVSVAEFFDRSREVVNFSRPGTTAPDIIHLEQLECATQEGNGSCPPGTRSLSISVIISIKTLGHAPFLHFL